MEKLRHFKVGTYKSPGDCSVAEKTVVPAGVRQKPRRLDTNASRCHVSISLSAGNYLSAQHNHYPVFVLYIVDRYVFIYIHTRGDGFNLHPIP